MSHSVPQVVGFLKVGLQKNLEFWHLFLNKLSDSSSFSFFFSYLEVHSPCVIEALGAGESFRIRTGELQGLCNLSSL